MLYRKLSELNTALFNGLPVISESDGNILFNTAYLSNIETVYLDRTNASIEYLNSSGVKGPGHYQDQSNYVAISNPVVGQVAMRTMLVKVPPNAGPGSVITVTAPTGNILSVSCILASLHPPYDTHYKHLMWCYP